MPSFEKSNDLTVLSCGKIDSLNYQNGISLCNDTFLYFNS